MQNYSQANQDLFVLNILKFKTEGLFLDIGCGDPSFINNSFLLEKEYNWSGISIDFSNFDYSSRKCKFYCNDATKIDFNKILKDNNFPNNIDYLSLDIDDSTEKCLNNLPLNDFDFKVITIEHDAYHGLQNVEVRERQRKVLSSFGYYLICSNVTIKNSPFEDWWINPKHINLEEYKKIICDKKDYSEIINLFS